MAVLVQKRVAILEESVKGLTSTIASLFSRIEALEKTKTNKKQTQYTSDTEQRTSSFETE